MILKLAWSITNDFHEINHCVLQLQHIRDIVEVISCCIQKGRVKIVCHVRWLSEYVDSAERRPRRQYRSCTDTRCVEDSDVLWYCLLISLAGFIEIVTWTSITWIPFTTSFNHWICSERRERHSCKSFRLDQSLSASTDFHCSSSLAKICITQLVSIVPSSLRHWSLNSWHSSSLFS